MSRSGRWLTLWERFEALKPGEKAFVAAESKSAAQRIRDSIVVMAMKRYGNGKVSTTVNLAPPDAKDAPGTWRVVVWPTGDGDKGPQRWKRDKFTELYAALDQAANYEVVYFPVAAGDCLVCERGRVRAALRRRYGPRACGVRSVPAENGTPDRVAAWKKGSRKP